MIDQSKKSLQRSTSTLLGKHSKSPFLNPKYVDVHNDIDSATVTVPTTVNPLKSFYEMEGISVYEDETSFSITIEMPGVKGKDITVDVCRDSLFIRGTRRLPSTSMSMSTSTSMDGRHNRPHGFAKKQRISRQLPLDSNVVNIQRAVANICNGQLVLYAPKRSKSISCNANGHGFHLHNQDDPVFEIFTPAAIKLGATR